MVEASTRKKELQPNFRNRDGVRSEFRNRQLTKATDTLFSQTDEGVSNRGFRRKRSAR